MSKFPPLFLIGSASSILLDIPMKGRKDWMATKSGSLVPLVAQS